MNRLVLISIVLLGMSLQAQDYAPTGKNILTEWAEKVSPENAWQEYPRPQLERAEWLNLNGLWDYAVTEKSQNTSPGKWDGKILVPFTIETQLSGVGRELSEEEAIWYQRTFELPGNWKKKAFILHFEASDFETTVWLNGELLGNHRGGYTPFDFDISGAVKGSGAQELLVKVHDPQQTIFKSLGKQDNRSESYERCSGIWQTVWIEPVPKKASIVSVKMTTSLESVSLKTFVRGEQAGLKLKYEVFDGTELVASATSEVNDRSSLEISSPKLWSPDSPFLYDIKVSLLKGKKSLDQVNSYCGLRTITLSDSPTGKDILLNGKPIFQMGPLDQNYWPGGGLTPPSDEALIWEAEYLRQIGCNMVRLHIKKNPSRFYYHCDRLGLLVWQDFISAQKRNRTPSQEESDFWLGQQNQIVETLYNHPSIVMWVIFNEAWGQHDSERIYDLVEAMDNTRLLSIGSGWDDVPGVGDIRDIHDYTFRPSVPVPGTETRAFVLGEAGGFASAVPPHNWTGRSNKTGIPRNPLFAGFDPEIPRDNVTTHDVFRPTYTYGENFEKQYSRFVDHLHLLQNHGLRAVIYTQMTDMKLEENGWLTFDRKVSKMDPDELGNIHRRLYTKPPVQTIVMPSSTDVPQSWEAAEIPLPVSKENRNRDEVLDAVLLQKAPDFDSLEWKQVKGPFGNILESEPGMKWDAKTQLLIRRSFNLNDVPERASIQVFFKKSEGSQSWMHTRIYINGTFVADDATRQFMSESRIAEIILPAEAMTLLREGENIITAQFVPGLVSRSGNVGPYSAKVLVDIAVTEF
jgi:hypothetical protein